MDHTAWSGSTIPDRKSKLGVAWQQFHKLALEDWHGPPFKPPRNIHSESWEGVFLCHTKLYVLADRYVIEDLKSLALYKIRRTLASFTLFPQSITDILELLRYTFENTREEDALRDLLVDYALCKVTYLLESDAWDTFIEEEPTFTRTLLAKLRILEKTIK
jgi:hypothetical protein